MVKKLVAVMLMIMLVVTQIECSTQSKEYESNKLPPTLCEAKCDITCAKHIRDYTACVRKCVRACYGVPPSVETKTVP
jgi:hypothetical protein